jgi:hypothetical protein
MSDEADGRGLDRRTFMTSAAGVAGLGLPGDPFRDGASRGDTAALDAERLAQTGAAVVDVTDHGVVGDGETDDSTAFQDAVDEATPHGVLYVPGDAVVHLENPVDVALEHSPVPVGTQSGPQNRFAFICRGTLHPAPGIGDAVHVHDGRYPYVTVQVDGGGRDLSENAVRVSNVRGGYFEGAATNYAGTVYRFDNGQGLTTSFSIGTLQTRWCGQSISMAPGDAGGEVLVGLGEIGNVWDIAPVRCPEFHQVWDLSWNQYENVVKSRTERGLVFEDCGSLWFDKLAVGGDADVTLADFDGVEGCHVNSFFATHAAGTGVRMRDVTNGKFRITSIGTARGLDYGGDSTNNRIVLNARNNADGGVLVREDAFGHLQLSGNVVTNGRYGVRVDATDARVRLAHLHLEGNGGRDVMVPEESNEVRLADVDYEFLTGRPKAVEGVGLASGTAERPDDRRWRVGDRVVYTDTDDDSGTGLYLQTPDGWVRLQTGDARAASPATETATPTSSPATETGTESGGVAGFGAGAAATAVGVAGVRLLRRGDD